MYLKKKNINDPLKRFVEKENSKEVSPMNPPESYSYSGVEEVPYEQMSNALKQLIEEHKLFTEMLVEFETSLIKWGHQNWIFDKDINRGLKNFFIFINEKIPAHNYKEEKFLFPGLRRKLIESGEYNKEDHSKTAIEVLEDEHIKISQAGAVVFNFLGLASKLNHKPSKGIIFQITYEQGIKIVETMKLHIFMEDKTLFPLAMKLFTQDELNDIDRRFFTPL